MGKIIDVMNECIKEGKPFFSFEFFPPKTPDGVDNLFERMDRMVSYGPTFCDITWGAGGSTAELTLDIADRMQNEINVECMMHLTCTNMPEEKLATALTALKKFGVKNILALRGDPPQGQEKFQAVDGGFSCALDLIKYIRKETGAVFSCPVPTPPRPCMHQLHLYINHSSGGHPRHSRTCTFTCATAACSAGASQYIRRRVNTAGIHDLLSGCHPPIGCACQD